MHQRAWEDVIGDRSILFESRISADQYSGTGSAINPCPLGRVAAGVTLPCFWKRNVGLDGDLKKKGQWQGMFAKGQLWEYGCWTKVGSLTNIRCTGKSSCCTMVSERTESQV